MTAPIPWGVFRFTQGGVVIKLYEKIITKKMPRFISGAAGYFIARSDKVKNMGRGWYHEVSRSPRALGLL
ncbi:TPA: hypothetical protein DCR79_00900 [Patescibacteria group bacterium]|nr:hypothetical protein [Patescibacteria group bacterium]